VSSAGVEIQAHGKAFPSCSIPMDELGNASLRSSETCDYAMWNAVRHLASLDVTICFAYTYRQRYAILAMTIIEAMETRHLTLVIFYFSELV
jgi:hypothetical protein